MASMTTPSELDQKMADMVDWHLSPIASRLDEMAQQMKQVLTELQTLRRDDLQEVVRHLDELDLKAVQMQRALGHAPSRPGQPDLAEHEGPVFSVNKNPAQKPNLSRDERIQRAFKRAALVLFEAWEEGWGHTRLLDEPLISDHLVEVGQSLKGADRREHVIPLKLIYDRCEKMFESGASVQSVAEFLQRHVRIVRIANVERQKIDHTLGLKTKMPEGWSFDDPGADIYARLRLGEVEWKPLEGA